MTFKPTDKPKLITSAKALDYLTEPGRYRDPETPGLYLQVVHADSRSWVLRYQFRGRPRNMGLGPFPLVTLKMARQLARDARLDLKVTRTDPLDAREQERAEAEAKKAKALSFREAAERWFSSKASVEWKSEGQRAAFRSQMERLVYPLIGKKPVAVIDVEDVRAVLQHDNLWLEKPTVAQMVRVRLDQILSWATAAKFRTGDNPASLRGPLSLLLPDQKHKTQHHKSLDYRELPAFMARLRAKDSLASKALQFLVLTATRRNETLEAKWSEIDLDARLWRIPAERMKTTEEHIVPLSEEALAILQSVYREDGNDFVFIGSKKGRHISDKLVRPLLADVDASPHGFRTTCRQWGENETSFAPHLLEEALSHIVTSKVERAYRRGKPIEKHREIMQAWGRYCSGDNHKGEVIKFRGRG